jgi:hypothetical protein
MRTVLEIGKRQRHTEITNHMSRRILASIAFLMGGAVTFLIFWILRGLGHMEAGMSDGTVPAPPFAEALIPWFAISYFAVSAVGVLIARMREPLWLAAASAHLVLFVTFCLLCSEALGEENTGNVFINCLRIAFIFLIFFSPWFVLWGVILTKAKGLPSVIQPKDIPAKQDRPAEKYANEIKLKY